MKTKDGLWRLSPSSLYAYTECQSCFWVNNHYRRAPMLPLLLNTAMDSILKARYDRYRAEGLFPPEAAELMSEGLAPFPDLAQLNDWRENIRALEVVNEEVGFRLVGKIDDVLLEADGRLVPADYKSSGKAPGPDKKRYYIDQLTAYGFMFREHGYAVSDRAYLLHYFVADANNPSIEVKFASYVDRVDIDAEGMADKLAAMVALLDRPYPGHNPDCSTCAYYDGRNGYIE